MQSLKEPVPMHPFPGNNGGISSSECERKIKKEENVGFRKLKKMNCRGSIWIPGREEEQESCAAGPARADGVPCGDTKELQQKRAVQENWGQYGKNIHRNWTCLALGQDEPRNIGFPLLTWITGKCPSD